MPRKTDDGRWLVDMRPDGAHGKRVRKRFDTKAEALRFEAWVINQAIQGEWNPKPADRRKLSELTDLWYQAHGQHLRDGERRHKRIRQACQALGEPVAKELTPEQYLIYRESRITQGITPKTCNNELGYLNAVYNELHRTRVINYPNPLAVVRMIRLPESELTFLDDNQIRELLDALRHSNSPHVYYVAKLCLVTGCRWSEAQSIKPRHLVPHKVTFTDTKSGKNRTVPLSQPDYQEVSDHLNQLGNFTQFTITAFRRILDRTSIRLPKGQATHVLRHTFASHFMINGGNILTLQRILGHASITMTMKYAHLAPDHLEDAVKFNPLSKQSGQLLDNKKKVKIEKSGNVININ